MEKQYEFLPSGDGFGAYAVDCGQKILMRVKI